MADNEVNSRELEPEQEKHLSSMQGSAAEMKDALKASEMQEKMKDLQESIENLSNSMTTQSPAQATSEENRNYYINELNQLQKQLGRIQEDWMTLSENLNTQLQRLDSLFSSFPSAIEISTVKTLSLRVSQLEQMISQHIGEERSRQNFDLSRKQLRISFVLLLVTLGLWGVWIGLQLLNN